MAAAAHFLPAVTSLAAIRRGATPGLAGTGRADHVALTFDDGPDPVSTPMFLDQLGSLGIKATFFMLGSMARRAPEVAAEVVSRGHEVALHGYGHRAAPWRGVAASRREMTRGFDWVTGSSGAAPSFVRPPYGLLTSPILIAARRLSLRPVLWTVWGRDWRAEATPASVAAEVVAGLSPGGTILLHDSDCTSAPGAWRSALGALPAIAEACAAMGVSVGPLSEHF
ncbi:MAG: polysaccharide deacetylase family protein [Acidimicrobiales bacterium]